MTPTPSVVVSVVSGSDPAHLLRFLDSLRADVSASDNVRVVAIVNRPDEAVAARVRECADARVDVWVNAEPLGFAANHNRVLRSRSADFYLISNDDIVVHPNAIAKLLAFMESADGTRTAVASPKLLNLDGTMQPCTYSFPSFMRAFVSVAGLKRRRSVSAAFAWFGRRLRRYGDGRSLYWSHDRQVYVDSVKGAFVLVRASAVAEVGVMDEASLVGREELEWHKRMHEAGWRVAFVPDAEVTHVGSATVANRPDLEVEFAKGTFNYFDKHHPAWEAMALRGISTAAFAIRWSAAFIRRDSVKRSAAASGVAAAVRRPRTI